MIQIYFLKQRDIDRSKELMNTELIKVHNRFLANKLVLNISKTNFMTVGNICNSNISNVDSVIDGLEIEQLKTVKVLGVFIDEDMKWKSHISNILTNVSRNFGKMRDYLPQHILLLISSPTT